MRIPLHPPAQVRDLAAALARYAASPAEERDRLYRDEVFPWAAQRMLAERLSQPPARLLVVPVGMQPYAPLLAALATPAARVALLVTGETSAQAAEVAGSLAQLTPPPLVETFSIGDANSGIALCKAVDAALFWAGDPWPTDVTLDVTGGRKATSAALGALAGLRGFRQVYIEGRNLEGGLFVDERLLVLDDVRSWLQEDHRAAAMALFEAGAFASAVERFDALAERILAGPALGWLRRFATAALEPTSAPAAFAALAADLPEGPIRDAVASLQAAGPAEASAFLLALQREGAWR